MVLQFRCYCTTAFFLGVFFFRLKQFVILYTYSTHFDFYACLGVGGGGEGRGVSIQSSGS